MFFVRGFTIDSTKRNEFNGGRAGGPTRKPEEDETTPDFCRRLPVKVRGFGKVVDKTRLLMVFLPRGMMPDGLVPRHLLRIRRANSGP